MKRFKNYLMEGGASGKVRYNTELASLLSFTNLKHGIEDFDPTMEDFDPEEWFDSKLLKGGGKKIYLEIMKFLPDNFNSSKFSSYYDYCQKIKPVILSVDNPKILNWVGGSNAKGADANPADVEFISGKTAGISIKDVSGITLSNLSPKSIGLQTPKNTDSLQYYSNLKPSLYIYLKKKVFKDAIALVTQKNPEFIPDGESPRYNIKWIDNDTIELNSKKKSITIPRNHFDKMSDKEFLKNTENQSVFGAHLTKNIKKYKPQLLLLYKTAAEAILPILQNKMVNSDSLMRLLNISNKSYIYQNKKHVYYVPSKSEFQNSNLELKHIVISDTLKSSGILFKIHVGLKGSTDFCNIDLWVRYGNRAYGSNSTVRVQSIKNPEYMAWRKL